MIDSRDGVTHKPVPDGQQRFPAKDRKNGPGRGNKPKSQKPSPDNHPTAH